MKKLLLAAIIILVALATTSMAQNRQFTVSKQGNLTTVYDTQRGQTYYFYDQTPQTPAPNQYLPAPTPRSSRPSVGELLKIEPSKRWIFDD